MPGLENAENKLLGKDMLLSLLQKRLGSSLTLLEKNTSEQMSSLKMTSKTFSDFDTHLLRLTKQIEDIEKVKKVIEKDVKKDKPKVEDKEMIRSHTVGKFLSAKKLLPTKGANNNAHSIKSANGLKTPKPVNKIVSSFKTEEDEKKKIMKKSNTVRNFNPKKNETEAHSTLNQSLTTTPKKKPFLVSSAKKKAVKDSIKNVSIKKEHKKEEENKSQIDLYIKKHYAEKWVNAIFSYLCIRDKLSFASTTRIFKPQYIGVINGYEENVIEVINLNEGQTIDEKIEDFKIRYKVEESIPKTYPEFQITKGALRAIELLNNDKYNQLFKKTVLDQNQKEIVVIYRLLFRLLNEREISEIEDDSAFWLRICEYFNEKGIDKIGSFLIQAAQHFNFDDRNVYFLNKLIVKRKSKINPSYYSKLCSSTGLVMFLIKDSLEYCGVMFSEKRTPHNRLVNNLIYEKGLLERIRRIKEFVGKL